MDLTGRRESSNVDDRRRMSGTTKAGIGGLAGVIIACLMAWLSGGNVFQAFQQAGGLEAITNRNVTTSEQQDREFTEEEQQLALFASQVLASTEDVWTDVFKKQLGKTYIPPRMVLYTGSVMKSQLGADGDFAYAYVIAHEVGHHVQHLLGTLNSAHGQMAKMNEAQANKVSVRIELQADYYAGVWGHHEGKTFGSLDDGDLMEAINCAKVIGDNYLQEKARGYSTPESFTHGTSAQRMKWLKLGLQTGDMSRGNTFGVAENQL